MCGRDWSSDVCSSDLGKEEGKRRERGGGAEGERRKEGERGGKVNGKGVE